jgi:hypothetical protein
MYAEEKTKESLLYRVSCLGQNTVHARMFDLESCEEILLKIESLKDEAYSYLEDDFNRPIESFELEIVLYDIKELQDFFEHLIAELEEELLAQ